MAKHKASLISGEKLIDEEGEGRDFNEDYTKRRTSKNESEGDIPFICRFCGKGCPSEHGLSIHIGRSHGKETRKEKYVCEVEGCGKVYTWKTSFNIHLMQHKAKLISASGEKLMETKLTKKEEMENEEDESIDSEEHTSKRTQRNFKDLPFRCSFCGNGYPNKHGLQVHVGWSHGKKTRKEKYVCEVEGCGKVYGWKHSLRNHMAKHATNPVPSSGGKLVNISKSRKNNEFENNDELSSEEDESSDSDEDYTRKKKIKKGSGKKYPFNCSFCGKGCPNEHGLSVHIGRSHGKETRKEKYVCEVEGCGNVYGWKHSLRNHMAKHATNTIYRNKQNAINLDKLKGDDLPFSCSFCGKNCPNEHSLSVHIGRSHGKQTRKDKYVCEVEGCGNVYGYKHSFRNHMAQHGANLISGEKNIDLSKLKRNETTQNIVCTVEGCGMEFARIQSYKIHVKRHEKCRKFTCDQCGKMFYHQSSLNYHLGAHERNTVPTTLLESPKGRGRGRPVGKFRSQHSDDPSSTVILEEEMIPREKKKEIFKCRFCEKVFKNNRALTVHKGLLHKDLANSRENYVCSVQGCGKVYEHYQRQHYRLHMAKHRNETRFKCLLCGKEFYQQFTFLCHKQTHKRKFQCEYCGRDFPNRGQLWGHTRIHKKYTPKRKTKTEPQSSSALVHICDVCGKSFKRLPYLKRHKQFIHEKNWVAYCELCGKGMRAMQHLRLHMRISHKIFEDGVQLYTCPVEGCRKKFYDERRYGEHMKELHPNGGEGDPMPFTCEHCGRGFWRLSRWKEHLLTHKFVAGKRSRNKIVME